MERNNAWAKYDAAGLAKIEAFAKDYCAFLDGGKTERECVALAVKAAKENGFADLFELVKEGKRLQAGDKVYVNWMNKSFVNFVIGKEPITAGMNIVGAHIDSPRIDVKQNPLYEDSDLAYLDTHYYGGIKKYQWVAPSFLFSNRQIFTEVKMVPNA